MITNELFASGDVEESRSLHDVRSQRSGRIVESAGSVAAVNSF